MTARDGVDMGGAGAMVVAPITHVGSVQFMVTIAQIANSQRGMPMLDEAVQSVAKHFQVVMMDAASGLGAVMTTTAGIAVQIKKGGLTSYSTITPTLAIVGTSGLLDMAFTGSHLDTLGISAVNVTGPGLLANNDLFVDVAAAGVADANVVQWLGLTPSGLVSGLVPATALALGGTAPASIATAVLDAARTGHVALGSVGEGVALAAALLQGNFLMDDVVNTDPNGQTAARLRVFHTGSAAGAATSGGSGEGEFATFLVATTYSGPGKVLVHRVTQQ